MIGTLTFLFTDLEGSSRLWERFPHAMKQALERHDTILRSAVTSANAQMVKATGDGFMAVFPSPRDAVSACLVAQHGLAEERWGEEGPLRVRMGLHAGAAEARGEDYYGPTLNRAARLMAGAHGGQVLLSTAAAALVMDDLPDGATLRDLGEHRLKDLGRPERVYQLVHPHLLSDFPPLATLSARPNNLPVQPLTFVGREFESREIKRRLGEDSVRLLTLTGPGGTGKTQLALRAAAEQIDRFDDGAFFVDLSTVRDTDSALAAIARAIGLKEASDQSLFEKLTSELRDQRVLLLLDNFEQVTVAAPTASQLLRDCPGLKELVTSREALRVSGEHLFPVPPLGLPDATVRHPSADTIAGCEAVQLFVERAGAIRPDFRLTDQNAAAVAEICRRLDGLPLAIELAAARLKLFSPEALRDRLQSRLEVLRSGARDLPARQQTLRAAIEWSFQLLDPGEQRLFELLSVFSTARFDAVAVVADKVDHLQESGIDVLDGLESLLDKSLVRQPDLQAEELRLVMLETIREYAAERLEDRPEFKVAARRAHAAYFADFAHERWEQLTGAGREVALAAMAAELENLRSAWRYWVAERDLDQLNKLVDGLWVLYDARGWYHATIGLTRDLLNVLSSTPSSPERAAQEMTLRTSLARALLATKGYTREAEEAYASALELVESNPDLQLFPVLRGLASFYVYRGDFDKAAAVGREILRLAEQQNDRSMLVDGHLVVGASLSFQDDLHVGLDHLERAIAAYEPGKPRAGRFRLGNDPGVACFTTSAFLMWLIGLPDSARERADHAVALATRLGHPFTLAYALFHSGFLHLWRGEPELVLERAEGVLAVVDENDIQIWRALGTLLSGAAKTGLDRFEEGLAEMRQGINLYQGLTTPAVFWPLVLFVEAGAHARANQPARGLAALDEALAVEGQGSGRTLVPEFCVLRGDLVLLADAADRATAETWYRQAFDVARELGVRMSELRAAMRLCRLQRGRGHTDVGVRALREVYETFTEGFATPDLTDARALLDSMSR
jgi:predicted ATPase/class 3 adenylate cyclase